MQDGGQTSGKYRMLRRIAGGGMGEVYLAAANGPAGFHKLAVVKRILPHFAGDPDFVAMFVNEARLAAALDHPNIVRVYDFGEVQGGFFYAMEYLHGDSLASLLPRTLEMPERMPLGHVLTIGLGVCAGLHFAHERRGSDGQPLAIVHRDVSPGNVFVTVEGEVKILDFGIAKAMSSTGVTRDGVRKGKVPYMSPEQCIGAALDRRSDVFAIGILLYEMTTLSRLFRGSNEFATMNMITTGQVPRPSQKVPGYPPALEAVVLRALSCDKSKRHASALELHEDLERVADELGVRTSSLALGRFVRQLLADKPYPSPEAMGSEERSPDEVQTKFFFDEINDALTRRDNGVLPLPPPRPPVQPPAQGLLASRPSGPELASRPSGPELASRPSGPELASRPSGPELASRPSGPELASRPATSELPTSQMSELRPADLSEVLTPAPRRRPRTRGAMVAGGALVALAVVLAFAWPREPPAAAMVGATDEEPLPVAVPEPPPPERVAGVVDEPEATTVTRGPMSGDPPVRTRGGEGRTPKKKPPPPTPPPPPPSKKPNVLDSLRPSK